MTEAIRSNMLINAHDDCDDLFQLILIHLDVDEVIVLDQTI